MMQPAGGVTLQIPIENLVQSDGRVHLQYLSQGARASYQGEGGQARTKVLDPYRIALVRLEDGGWAVVAWGGGGRVHANHTVELSERVTKVTAWRNNMSQLITSTGLVLSWSKSTQCGSCGGIPEPQGYPWDAKNYIAPGGFQPSMIQEEGAVA